MINELRILDVSLEADNGTCFQESIENLYGILPKKPSVQVF